MNKKTLLGTLGALLATIATTYWLAVKYKSDLQQWISLAQPHSELDVNLKTRGPASVELDEEDDMMSFFDREMKKQNARSNEIEATFGRGPKSPPSADPNDPLKVQLIETK